MEIALVQSDIVWGDPAANCKRLDSLLSSAPRADLYVLPEMFSTGFNGVCESDPSETLGYLRDKARSCGCAFAGSLAISFPDRLSANRFFFCHSRGTILLRQEASFYLCRGAEALCSRSREEGSGVARGAFPSHSVL